MINKIIGQSVGVIPDERWVRLELSISDDFSQVVWEFISEESFPNPFDGYFWLMENYKEEEIV